MKEKHIGAPWYGSQILDERAQAEAMLAALKEDPTAHITESAQKRVDTSLAAVIPKEGTQEDKGKPANRPHSPSFEDFRRVMRRAPSDLREYDYASGPHLEIRYCRTNPTPMTIACSLVSADLLLGQEEAGEEGEAVEEEEDESILSPISKKPKLE